jgi:hypothetical protein
MNDYTSQKLIFCQSTRELFFNTTLTHAIQRYRLLDDTMQRHGKTHRAPISCFAASSFGRYLVSVSPGSRAHDQQFFLTDFSRDPPHKVEFSVHACRGRIRADQVIFSPIEFGRSREGDFAVCLENGSVVLCDVRKCLEPNRKSAKNAVLNVQKAGKEVPRAHQAIGSHGPTISGAAWIPVDRPFLVTVGVDWHCNLIDFGIAPPRAIRRWNLDGPARAVAVTVVRSEVPKTIKNHEEQLERATRVAIGFDRGGVEIYNGRGRRLCQIPGMIGDIDNPILSLEWVTGRLPPGGSPRNTSTRAVSPGPAPQRMDTHQQTVLGS